MSNVLITGVAGLFGANFSRHLLSKGYKVIGIDDLSGGYEEYLPNNNNFTFIKTNIWNDENLEQIFKKYKIDYVYHFAAFAAAGYSPFVREHNYKNNTLASAKLINESIKAGIKKFIFTSSMEVYGNLQPPFYEDDILKAVTETPYGIAKRGIELDLMSAKAYHGLEYSIIRPHNVHGIYQNIWDRYRNVIGIFIKNAINHEDIVVYGDGSQVRAFSDIKFCMSPLELIMTKGNGETFNIGADKSTTVLELAKLVQKTANKFGNQVTITHAETRKEVHAAFCNHNKAIKELDFCDKTNLEDLVNEMYSWALIQPNKEIRTLKPELKKALYSYWK